MTTETETAETTETKKRKTKSWKTEAEKLEGLLVSACLELTQSEADTGHAYAEIEHVPAVAEWWEAYRDAHESKAAELRASALGKLSQAERAALNLPANP